mgnify:CR=1 FL=1
MMHRIVSCKNDIQNTLLISTIVFISDLHFDFVNGKLCIEESEEIKNSFISYIKNNYRHSIICILGDCFNEWNRVLLFIRELEQEKIRGFLVLGNHDYWNDGTKSYEELLDIFEKETRDNKFFHLLITGRKYYMGNLCFIGDTGWTSFVQNGKMADLGQFKNLPDSNHIKNFSLRQIISFHNNWIKYANEILKQEKNVIILTHYPMVCFAKKPYDSWWSSETKLKECKNCWKIFGHTHKARQKRYNHISAQRGYENKSKENLEELERYGLGYSQYTVRDFGLLVKVRGYSGLPSINLEPLIEFFNPQIVENPNTQIELVKEIRNRGYRRCSKNWEILAELAADPYKYIKYIKSLMHDYEGNFYIGYRYMHDLSEKTICAVYTAIASLEMIFETNDFSNPLIFVMSAIITGYVYSYMAEEIDNMRPVDYYDIVRFYLVFQTMKKYKLEFDDIHSIRKHSSRTIMLKNIPVGLPTLDKQCMTVEEAYACLKGTLLLTENNLIE